MATEFIGDMTLPWGDICITKLYKANWADVQGTPDVSLAIRHLYANDKHILIACSTNSSYYTLDRVYVYSKDESGLPATYLGTNMYLQYINILQTASSIAFFVNNTPMFWDIPRNSRAINVRAGTSGGYDYGYTLKTINNIFPEKVYTASMSYDGGDNVYVVAQDNGQYQYTIYKINVNTFAIETVCKADTGYLDFAKGGHTARCLYFNGSLYYVGGSLWSIGNTYADDVTTSKLPTGYMHGNQMSVATMTANFNLFTGRGYSSNWSNGFSFEDVVNRVAYKLSSHEIYAFHYTLADVEGFTTMPNTVHSAELLVNDKVDFTETDEITQKVMLIKDTTILVPYQDEYEQMPSNIEYHIQYGQYPDVDNYMGVRVHRKYKVTTPNGAPITTEFQRTKIIKVVNNPASIEATFSADTTHADNVDYRYRITDESNIDEITYQMTINDEVYIPYGLVYSAPLEVRGYIRPDELKIGANTVKLEVKSTFKGDTQVSSHTYTITKENKPPKVTLDVQSISAHIAMDDEDGDWIRFRIFLNGKQVLPVSDWSQGFNVPYNITYTLPRQYVNNGVANKVTVEVIDAGGDITKVEQNAVMNYSGLMFKDSNGKYYTNDKGEVLNVLDLGSITAGDPSLPAKVILENQLGYIVNNVKISCIPVEVDEEFEEIQFDTTSEFIAPQVELLFEDEMQNGGEIPFYVRVNTEQGAVGMGRFKIKASAEAVVG